MNLKYESGFLGIMTQCVRLSETQTDEKSLRNYCESLVRKINFKNGGLNAVVDLKDALNNKKSQDDSYMFFGAVLQSSRDTLVQHSSIAGMKFYSYR